MSPLSPNEKYLIHLIACYMEDRKPDAPYPGAKFPALLEMAKRQGIMGILAEMLGRIDSIPEKASRELQSVHLHCIRKDVCLRSAVDEIINGLESVQIRCMPLKGAEIKHLYPCTHHREMTDIDILIDFSEAENVQEWMEQAGFLCDGPANRNHFVFRRDEVTVEFHEELLDKDEYGASFSDGIWARTRLKAGYSYVYEMDATQTYLYLVLHLLQHYLDSGVGIRFLIDLAILQKNGAIDFALVEQTLRKYELNEFHQGLADLLQAWRTDTYQEHQIVFTKNLLEDHLYGASAQRAAQELIRSGSRSKRILHALFEPKEVLLRAYPSLRKVPWLFPFYYPHRILYRYFTRRKQAKSRWNAGKIDDERVEAQRALYEHLGLLSILKGERT